MIAAAILAALPSSASRAEFSEAWQAYAKEINAECDAFDSTLPPDLGKFPHFSERPQWPTPPGKAARPHVCVFVRFDIGGEGKTENIEILFKAPDNLPYAFVRKVELAVKKWRFEVPQSRPDGYSDLYVKVDWVPVKAWTYEMWFSLRNAGG